jgi:hypothetical protein
MILYGPCWFISSSQVVLRWGLQYIHLKLQA